MDELSQIDLAFCIDLTRSMEPFIQAARQNVLFILGGLRESSMADLRVAMVGYRDHDPGTNASPVEIHPFTAKDAETKAVLAKLAVGSAPSNTDAAEAVFAGLDAAGQKLAWRKNAFRIIVLVGDAPPHACGANSAPFPDRFPDADPTGLTLKSLAEALERAGVFLYALGMVPSVLPNHDHVLEAAFGQLARATGGLYKAAPTPKDAIEVLEAIGQRVFGQMEVDRRLYEKLARASAQTRGRARRVSGAAMAEPMPAGPMPAAPPMPGAPSMPAAYAPPPPAFGAPPAAPVLEADGLEAPADLDMSSDEVQASVARLKKRGLL